MTWRSTAKRLEITTAELRRPTASLPAFIPQALPFLK
jgi:hypothetical protein